VESVKGDTVSKCYAYDTAGRLSDVWEHGVHVAQYGYDGNGNRTAFAGVSAADTATATNDDQDRMLRYGNTRYTYRAPGELDSVIAGTDTTHYTYDPLGNLVSVKLPTGDRIDYLVDGRNRRVGRQLNGVLQRQWLYPSAL